MRAEPNSHHLLNNPCLSCGACCANFRVSFYWRETSADPQGTVPEDLTEPLNDFYACMGGTNRKEPYCVALNGLVGKQVSCVIYPQRSSTCREFGIHWVRGRLFVNSLELERCNQARLVHGLPPLEKHPPVHQQRKCSPPPRHPSINRYHPYPDRR